MQLCCAKTALQSKCQRKYSAIVCGRSKNNPKTTRQKQNKLKEASDGVKKSKGFDTGRGNDVKVATLQKPQARSVSKALEQEDVAWLVNLLTLSPIKKQKETFKIPKDCLAAAKILYNNQEYQAAYRAQTIAFEIIALKNELQSAFLPLASLNSNLNFEDVHSIKFANALLSQTPQAKLFAYITRYEALRFANLVNLENFWDELKLAQGECPKSVQQFLCLTNETLTSLPPIKLTVEHNLSKKPIQDSEKSQQQGDFVNAMGILLSLIYEKTDQVKEILKLRAETCFKSGDPFQAAIDITTYLVLRPKKFDATEITFFRAKCLRNMGLFQCALQVMQQEYCYQTSPILQNEANQLKNIIQATGIMQGSNARIRSSEFIEIGKQLDSLPRGTRKIIADSRLQDNHKQSVLSVKLPAQCDKEKSILQLDAGIQFARILSNQFEVRQIMPQSFKNSQDSKVLRRQSWIRKQWRKNAKIGSVNPLPDKKFSRSKVLSYNCLWQKPMSLVQGTAHVAVNYADLSFLTRAEYVGNAGDGPLHIVAIESSLYNNTKSQVIYQMMLNDDPVESILQVWYSSGWSEQTLKCFREAVSQLLENQLEKIVPTNDFFQQFLLSKVPQKPCVLDLLYVWLSAPLKSLKVSFDEWINLHPLKWYGAEFYRKQDLAAVASYSLSGRLLDCEYASVVMFSSFPLQNKIPFDDRIMRQIYEQEINLDLKSDTNVMDVVTDMLLAGIRLLKQKIVSNEIKIDFMLGDVKPQKAESFFGSVESEKSMIERIKEISPRSISWGDTVDYFEMNQFHDMLKQCSQNRETIHYISSILWSQDMKGTYCWDFSLKEQAKIYENILEQQAIDHSSLIYWPPITNTQELLDCYLRKKYYKTWLKVFFQKGGVKEDDVIFADIAPFSCSAMDQGTISLCYKYS